MDNARAMKIRKIRLLREKEKRESERSLAGFVRHAWSIVEPGRPYVHGWHLDAVCAHLEAVNRRQIRNLIINIPPRHTKSLTTSVFWPAWTWGPNGAPHEDWIVGSYTPKLSSRDSQKCRRIIESDWYVRNWAETFRHADVRGDITSLLREDQNEKMNYQNIHSGTRIATSVGGAGTGAGADFVLVDDAQKVKNAESEVQRAAVQYWWDNEMSTRANDPNTVCFVVIMQRIHEDDLCGSILSSEAADEWTHLCLPFEYEPRVQVDNPLGFVDPRKEPGEVLWPERFGERAIRKLKKTLDDYQWAGQMQQEPAPKQGTVFKQEWFENRYDPDEMPKITHVINAWDLTFDKTAGSAYNVGYALGLSYPNILVLDEVREKMDINDQIREIPALAQRIPGTREKLVENAANGKASVRALQKKIPGMVLVNPVGSKEDRANAVTWVFRGGNVLFPPDHHAPWVPRAIKEIVSFGPKAKYKDRVDALVHGVTFFEGKLQSRRQVHIESIEKLSAWAVN